MAILERFELKEPIMLLAYKFCLVCEFVLNVSYLGEIRSNGKKFDEPIHGSNFSIKIKLYAYLIWERLALFYSKTSHCCEGMRVEQIQLVRTVRALTYLLKLSSGCFNLRKIRISKARSRSYLHVIAFSTSVSRRYRILLQST